MSDGQYKPYPEYRSSGEDWVGVIPADWRILRGKFLFREVTERSESGGETLLSVSEYYGVKPRGDVVEEGEFLSRAESLEGYKKCQVDDLVMNIMLAWKRGLGVSKFEGIVSPAYSVFRFFEAANPDYMHYLLRADIYTGHFKTRSTGVIDSRLRLYPESFFDTAILVPPLPEQTQIAKFLDHETAKIDRLIEKQEALIRLLKEKRQAVISHAVTKGLNPHAPLKDSGIEWLGQVPEHWEILRIKFASTFFTSGPRGWSERLGDDGSLFIQSGDLNDQLGIEYANAKRVAAGNDAETSRTRLLVGDVVVCITGAKTGNVAVAETVPERTFINQHLCLVRPDTNTRPAFIGAFLKGKIGQTYFELSQYGLKQGLSLEDVKEAPIARPPLEEQSAIVEHVKNQTAKFDSIIQESCEAVTLLQERRTALISAAVTGKIDVSHWQPPAIEAA